MDNLDSDKKQPMLSFGTHERVISFWEDETFDVEGNIGPHFNTLKLNEYDFEVEIKDFKEEVLIILTLSCSRPFLTFASFTFTFFETFKDYFKAVNTYNSLLKITKFKAEELAL